MRIPYLTINNCRFTSKHKFGEDDSISQIRREFLREHILENSMPNYEIFSSAKKLEEYELNKLIASLCGQKFHQDSLQPILKTLKPKNTEVTKKILPKQDVALNHELIESLPLFNLALVSKKLGVYRGQTLNAHPNALRVFKEAGGERIVDLAGYEGLEDNCKQLGLEYFYYSTPPYYFCLGEVFKSEDEQRENYLRHCSLFGYSEKESRDYFETATNHWKTCVDNELKDFVEFIKTMQKGNLYIGCEYGTYATDNALMLNSVFNPLYVRTPKFITPYNRSFLPKLLNLYKNLTPEHKLQMGWSKEFDAYVLKNLHSFVK